MSKQVKEYIVKVTGEALDDKGEPLFKYCDEIVRCRDCMHMHTIRHWLGMDVDECWLRADHESGALGKEGTEPDGFCAWGERRE